MNKSQTRLDIYQRALVKSTRNLLVITLLSWLSMLGFDFLLHASARDEVEAVTIQALSHKERRNTLKMLSLRTPIFSNMCALW